MGYTPQKEIFNLALIQISLSWGSNPNIILIQIIFSYFFY